MDKKLVASTDVFPLVYLCKNDLDEYKGPFEQLMSKTNTKITFDYVKQYFHIRGRSQATCETVAEKIIKVFLPVTNEMLREDPFKSTYYSMERSASDYDYSAPTSPLSATTEDTTSNLNSPKFVRVTGRPPALEDIAKEETPASPGSPVVPSPSGPAQYYRGDTESEGESEEEHEFSGQFVFAKNISQPNDVLTGPPLSNKQQTNYLKLIEQATGTECALAPKSNVVNVIGFTQDAVDDALARFKQLQNLYKRGNKKATTVPCIHPNPKDSRNFKLYFAPMDRYRHKNMVFVAPEVPRPLFTLLPSYMDPQTGSYLKPMDLLDKSPSPSIRTESPRSSSPANYGPPPGRQAPRQSTRTTAPPPQQPVRQTPPPPPSPVVTQDSMPTATWGNRTIAQVKQTVITPEAEQWKSRQQIVPVQASSSPANDFPSLPSKPAKKPSIQTSSTGKPRRVMRISSQKASIPSNPTGTSIHAQCREYNFHNAKLALTEGLEYARGIHGEIRLGVKLGKVLWGNISPAMQPKMWPFHDIKDLAMKENKVVPVFNNVTTEDGEVINVFYHQFPENYSKTACYEIHAMARNQPSLEYQPIIMTVNPGAVGLQKVIVRQNRVCDIDWVSLDRKFDFQMYLHAETLSRTDVKPYSTFLKKLSINTTTCQMTYEDVPNFIKVTDVFYKETTKHRLHFPFVVEISRTQRLPLIPQPSMGFGVEKILADTGSGSSWYDCEVFYTSHNEYFKRNLDLSVGKLASWTVDDIMGEKGHVLVDYIQCMVLITENLQMAFPS